LLRLRVRPRGARFVPLSAGFVYAQRTVVEHRAVELFDCRALDRLRAARAKVDAAEETLAAERSR
jgi:hypothetical protein